MANIDYHEFFEFSKEVMDELVSQIAGPAMSLDTSKLFGFLTGAYHFAAYMEGCSLVDSVKKKEIQQVLKTFHGEQFPKLKKWESQALTYEKFPIFKKTPHTFFRMPDTKVLDLSGRNEATVAAMSPNLSAAAKSPVNRIIAYSKHSAKNAISGSVMIVSPGAPIASLIPA